MTYIDGFVAAVPTANREKFKKHADEAAAIFKEHGALSVVENWGDDVPEGKITSFPMAVQRKDDETVVFSWIVWPSKEARKAAWDKMMADPRMKPEANPMPFDGKRMIYGGFEPIVSSKKLPVSLFAATQVATHPSISSSDDQDMRGRVRCGLPNAC